MATVSSWFLFKTNQQGPFKKNDSAFCHSRSTSGFLHLCKGPTSVISVLPVNTSSEECLDEFRGCNFQVFLRLVGRETKVKPTFWGRVVDITHLCDTNGRPFKWLILHSKKQNVITYFLGA